MNFFKSKKPPRCFERDIEELTKEEKELFENEYDGIPMNLEISVSVLEKVNFKQGEKKKKKKLKKLKIRFISYFWKCQYN